MNKFETVNFIKDSAKLIFFTNIWLLLVLVAEDYQGEVMALIILFSGLSWFIIEVLLLGYEWRKKE